jgi:choline dehydrogenase-like flavoprotein
MLIDLQHIVDSSRIPSHSSVCIAGAGVAGLLLATALADVGIDVHLLEAGGHRNEDRSQSIYAAEMAASIHQGTTLGRFRVFGGSSTRWGGQILPFAEEVFSPTAELSPISWPICSDVLKPFYNTIEKILGVDDLPFDGDVVANLSKAVPDDLQSNPNFRLRFSKWAPFSRRNLARTLGPNAINSKRITVFLHANVTECLLSQKGSSIESYLVQNYLGTHFRFTAQHYVMATGTIEVSRLLLASRSVCAAGVGNALDQVGRNFHDHIEAPVARISGPARKKMLSWMGPFVSRGTQHTGRLEATPALRAQLRLPAMMAYLTIEEPEDSGICVLRYLLQSIQRRELLRAMMDSYQKLPAASLEVFRLGYAARVKNRRAVSAKAIVTLRVASEQPLNASNRIRLSERATDSLGVQKAVVDWRVSNDEILAMRRYAQFVREELRRLSLDSIQWQPGLIEESLSSFPEIRDTNHPMGGTIMGRDPKRSVVDENLQVHGVCNLWIASCSTFPSGGSSNPTFTMMALALRLSERLQNVVRSGNAPVINHVLSTRAAPQTSHDPLICPAEALNLRETIHRKASGESRFQRWPRNSTLSEDSYR